MLNLIWLLFFVTAFLCSLYQYWFLGNMDVFNRLMQALFDMSKTAFDIAIGLTGVLSLWLGIMKIGERSGFIKLLTRLLTPLFSRLLPDIPQDHPALAAITMNISANALGLDNAATPLGIKAMQEMQTLNNSADTATNAQILFLVINTSAVTLFPITIFTYRAQLGASFPTDVFIPILIATYMSTLAGLLSVAWAQRINLLDKVILAYLGGFSLLILAIVLYFSRLDQTQMLQQSTLISNFILFLLIMTFLIAAAVQRINAYDAFIEGAQEGFHIAVKIIPYLVAMLAAIGVFRASGALSMLSESLRSVLAIWQLDDRFIDALPTALMKPFSGSGARALMIDTMHAHGADSLAGRIACTVQGSTETTFYVLAVYFGAVGIKRVRHAAVCGLIADFAGIVTAILVSYWFFA